MMSAQDIVPMAFMANIKLHPVPLLYTPRFPGLDRTPRTCFSSQSVVVEQQKNTFQLLSSQQ